MPSIVIPWATTIPAEDFDFWRAVIARGLAVHQSEAIVDEDGEEMLDALATVFTWMDARDAKRMLGGYFFEGEGPRKTLGSLNVTFPSTLSGDATIVAGSPMLKTADGVVFVALEDVVIPAAGGTLQIYIAAEWEGYDGNVSALLAASLIDRWFVDDDLAEPELAISWGSSTADADKTIVVADMLAGTATINSASLGPVPNAFANGSDGPLDLLATSRGVYRLEGEGDLALALRARSLALRVTPNNIKAVVDEILALVGVECYPVDWYNAESGGAVSWCFDDTTLGAFDVSPFGQRNRFVVIVPDFPYDGFAGGWAFGELGGAFDVAPFGAVFATHDEVLAAVEEAIETARAFGYGGEVVLVDPAWTPTPGTTT